MAILFIYGFLVPQYYQWPRSYYKRSLVKSQSRLGYITYICTKQRGEIKRTCRSGILSNWRTMYIISNIVIAKSVLKSFSGYLPDDDSEKIDTQKVS